MNEVVGHRFSLSMSILLAGLPLLQRGAVARRFGYDTVESWWPWSEDEAGAKDIGAFATSLEDEGVQLLLVNVSEGDARFGGRGMAGVPGADASFWRNWNSVLEVVGRTGAAHINVLVGNRQGSGGATDEARTVDRLIERLAVLADQAHEVGAGVVVEQLNRFDHPNYLLSDPEKAAAVVTQAMSLSTCGDVGLLADVYHLSRSGTDPVSFAADHAGIVRHVQIADAPGRGRPGSGTAPIRETLEALGEAGYDGKIGLEYVPAGDENAILARPQHLWRALRSPISEKGFHDE